MSGLVGEETGVHPHEGDFQNFSGGGLKVVRLWQTLSHEL